MELLDNVVLCRLSGSDKVQGIQEGLRWLLDKVSDKKAWGEQERERQREREWKRWKKTWKKWVVGEEFVEMCEKEAQEEAEKGREETKGKDEKQKNTKEKKMIEKKKKKARGGWGKNKDPIRTLLEERPVLLIGLASSKQVNSLTRGEALTLTEEFLRQGYWVSSKVIWAQSFADSLVRNIVLAVDSDTDDPRFEQLISGIMTIMTKKNELLISLLNAFLVALRKQSLASPEHLMVPMDSSSNGGHDSKSERFRLCLAALSMWGIFKR